MIPSELLFALWLIGSNIIVSEVDIGPVGQVAQALSEIPSFHFLQEGEDVAAFLAVVTVIELFVRVETERAFLIIMKRTPAPVAILLFLKVDILAEKPGKIRLIDNLCYNFFGNWFAHV